MRVAVRAGRLGMLLALLPFLLAAGGIAAPADDGAAARHHISALGETAALPVLLEGRGSAAAAGVARPAPAPATPGPGWMICVPGACDQVPTGWLGVPGTDAVHASATPARTQQGRAPPIRRI